MKKVLFLHGLSSDGSNKSTFIRSLGFNVTTPKLSDWSFTTAVAEAQEVYDSFKPDVVVGSSRGGAVAMNLQSGETLLILLAPAWKWWGSVDRITKQKCVVIHSKADNLVSFRDSEKLWKNSTNLELIDAGADHRLNDFEAQEALKSVLERI